MHASGSGRSPVETGERIRSFIFYTRVENGWAFKFMMGYWAFVL